MSCTKQYSLEVEEESSLDFDNLVWGPGIFIENGVPVAEQPGILEGEWDGNEAYELGGGGGAGAQSLVDNTGSLLYTGDAVNCNLELNITQFTPRAPFFDPATSNARIEVTQDAVPILTILISVIAAVGVSNFPFTVNAGVASLIEVRPFIDNPINGVIIEFTAILTPA